MLGDFYSFDLDRLAWASLPLLGNPPSPRCPSRYGLPAPTDPSL